MKTPTLAAVFLGVALASGSVASFAQGSPEYKKFASALQSGNADAAAAAFDGSGLKGDNRLKAMKSVADAYYRSKQYANAVKWYSRYIGEGGSDPSARKFRDQAEELAGGGTKSPSELRAEIAAAEKAGGSPSEGRIGQLARLALDAKDMNGFVWAMEKMVAYYPKKEYWGGLLGNLPRKPGFSDRFSLELYRLRLETGHVNSADDYMELAQMAVQAGFPFEGMSVIEQGFKAGALGAGAGADRHKRLRDLVQKRVDEARPSLSALDEATLGAKTGDELVKLGYNLVTAGQSAKGVEIVNKGLSKGGFKRAEDAKLLAGLALWRAGDAKANSVLRSVQGQDGASDIGRLWTLLSRKR